MRLWSASICSYCVIYILIMIIVNKYGNLYLPLLFPFWKILPLFSQLSFRTKSGLCYAFLLHFLFLLKAQIIQMISTLSEWSFSNFVLYYWFIWCVNRHWTLRNNIFFWLWFIFVFNRTKYFTEEFWLLIRERHQ